MMPLKKPTKAKRAAPVMEYAIIASMLSAVIIIGLEATGVALGDSFEATGAKLENAFEAASGGVSPNLESSPDTP